MTAATSAILPETDRTAPDPLVTAALEKFNQDTCNDQLGCTRPEPSLSFVAGPSVVIRSVYGEVLSQIPIAEIQTPTT